MNILADSHQNDEEASHGLYVVGEGVEPEHLVKRRGHLGRAQEPRAILQQQLHRSDVPAEHLGVGGVIFLVEGEGDCAR